MVGNNLEISQKITKDDARKVIEMSGEINPIHVNEEFTRRIMFKGWIVHSRISLMWVSVALTKLMGFGKIWLSRPLNLTTRSELAT